MRNSLSLIFWFLFYPNSAISERSNRHIISDTSIGKIRGRVENIAGSDIDLFLGIPYAKPPVGELRFEKPKPLDDNASREIDALAHPKVCIPHHRLDNRTHDWNDYSEDCLYLDVFALHNDQKAENPPAHQPILVLICVGGFQTGSMRRYTKNVTEIVLKYVRKGIIVVAIQFRIGFLGFASTGDSEMPGNFAYWDMTEALRWIRKNADKFDGDPDRITLLGYSSAGSSIATLGLSPHSSYLFDQAIQMSGPIITCRAASDRIVSVTYQLAIKLGCSQSKHDSSSIKRCLKQKSIDQFMDAMDIIGPTRPDYNYILIGPRIDGDFIPTNFLKLMKTAKPKKTILGITEMEPLGFTLLLGNNSLRQLAIPKSEFSSFDKEQLKSYMLQKAIKREYFDGQANEIANDVVEFYTSGNATIKDNWFYLEKAVQFLNDIQFVAPTVWEVQAKLAKQWPMFLYINKYINKRRFPDDFKIRKNFHDNDHMYVLRNPYSTFEYDASDIIMEEFMEQFFANFILKGDPSIPGVAEWPMSNSTHPLQHMVIDLPRPKTEFKFDGLDGVHFWENILKKYSQYDLIMGVAAEKSPSVENWSNVPIMELIVSQRWLFSLANKNISSKEGDVCDPESALWKATAIPHRFLSCHGVDRVYIANDCRVIYGKQKLFDEETQQCVFPPDVTLHSNKRFVTSTGNIHEVSHLDPNFMTSAEESRMKYFDESGIEDEIENIQLNFGTSSNFKPFVKFDKPQVENRLWKINTPSRKPFAIGEKDLTENNNESLNESRISQTVNVGNQPLLSKPRIVKVPLNRVNGSWKYANTCPERRRPMLYLGKDIPVICSRSSMERDSRNAAIILDDCNHADYRCTFSSDRDEYGICCQRLSYLQIQCTLQSRPLLLEVDRQNVNMMRQPVDCSPRHLCPTLKNFGNPACIFDMGDYHCCEYIEDHNHPLNSTQNGETYYETSVVINTKGVLRRSDDSSVTKVPSKVANFRKRKGKGTISPIFIPVHDHRNGCPPGEEPFRVPFGDNTILDCNETLPDQCPPGFSCYKQRNMRRQKARCCGVTNVCGGNSAALLNPENKISVKCNLRKGKGCPEPFFCYEQSSTCCSLDPVAGLCAYGMGQVDERGNAVSCDAQNPCVAGFVCTERFNKRFCCPTELNICTQPKNTGLPCILSPPQKSFYFDVMTGECEKFDHTGCYGKSRSDNRFETKEQCLQLCSNIDSSQICKDSRNQNPVMCDPLKAHQCSLGQQCVVYDHSGIGFCCAKKTPRPQSRNTDFIRTVHHNTVCPAGLTSKLPGVSNSPTFCDPNNSKSCPPFSRCDHSDHYQAFICCTSNVNNAQNLITDDIIYN